MVDRADGLFAINTVDRGGVLRDDELAHEAHDFVPDMGVGVEHEQGLHIALPLELEERLLRATAGPTRNLGHLRRQQAHGGRQPRTDDHALA